ncbi:MAG: nucleotidyltransferase domain-containing protein [Neisseriaceae bacterium]|nr:nucleotidyltransferase domain-containing protein [Neisseriaceae bacterium]MBR3425598.1 nucleotidyltransferase domain-containing protein [Neisseriaceae bacterium]
MMNNQSVNAKVEIQKYLNNLPKKENISVLWAVESGSRAWGFPSPDSDYDVRGIYIYPQDEYLKIFSPQESIEFISNQWFDVGLWDIRKVGKLLQKSNAVIFEWFNSPIIYHQDNFFAQNFAKILNYYFNPQAVIYHYRGIAKSAMAQMNIQHFDLSELNNHSYKLKKFFYLLRSLLAADFVLKEQKIPPIVIFDLMKNHSLEIQEEIKNLIDIKSCQDEKYTQNIPTILWQFVIELWENICDFSCQNYELSDIALADDFFKKLLNNFA